MMRYLIQWEIELDSTDLPGGKDGATPLQAAKAAVGIFLRAVTGSPNDDTRPLCFTVDDRETSETHHVDLAERPGLVEFPVMAVALKGNLTEGFIAYGPFAERDDAAEAHPEHDAWITLLTRKA